MMEKKVEIVIDKNWKRKVPEGQTPIDELYSGNDLLYCIHNKVYSCEKLVIKYMNTQNKKYNEFIENLSNIDFIMACSKFVPCIHPTYTRLLLEIFSMWDVQNKHIYIPKDYLYENKQSDSWYISYIKDTFAMLCIRDSEDMKSKISEIISILDDSSCEFVVKFYNLDGKGKRTYEELAEEIPIKRIMPKTMHRKILQTLYKNRHVIFKTDTILDGNTIVFPYRDKKLSYYSISYLFNANIMTKESLLEFSKGDMDNAVPKPKYDEIYKFLANTLNFKSLNTIKNEVIEFAHALEISEILSDTETLYSLDDESFENILQEFLHLSLYNNEFSDKFIKIVKNDFLFISNKKELRKISIEDIISYLNKYLCNNDEECEFTHTNRNERKVEYIIDELSSLAKIYNLDIAKSEKSLEVMRYCRKINGGCVIYRDEQKKKEDDLFNLLISDKNILPYLKILQEGYNLKPNEINKIKSIIYNYTCITDSYNMIDRMNNIFNQLPKNISMMIKLAFGIDCDSAKNLLEISSIMGMDIKTVCRYISRGVSYFNHNKIKTIGVDALGLGKHSSFDITDEIYLKCFNGCYLSYETKVLLFRNNIYNIKSLIDAVDNNILDFRGNYTIRDEVMHFIHIIKNYQCAGNDALEILSKMPREKLNKIINVDLNYVDNIMTDVYNYYNCCGLFMTEHSPLFYYTMLYNDIITVDNKLCKTCMNRRATFGKFVRGYGNMLYKYKISIDDIFLYFLSSVPSTCKFIERFVKYLSRYATQKNVSKLNITKDSTSIKYIISYILDNDEYKNYFILNILNKKCMAIDIFYTDRDIFKSLSSEDKEKYSMYHSVAHLIQICNNDGLFTDHKDDVTINENIRKISKLCVDYIQIYGLSIHDIVNYLNNI